MDDNQKKDKYMILLELARQVGLDTKWVASTYGGEYASSCPNCGGKDRFRIWPAADSKNCKGKYWCRQCARYGDSIQFARDFLGLSFEEAIEHAHANIKIDPFFYLPQQYKKTVLQKPLQVWLDKACMLVNYAHKSLLEHREILDYLALKGLSCKAIEKYKIGWLSQDHFYRRSEWGLEESDKQMWLPSGIVIPTIEQDRVVTRIKIRRDTWKEGDEFPKYIAVSGSMNGLSIIGDKKHKAMIIVESELDAYAIDYAVGDFLCAVAVGSSLKNPDNLTDLLARQATNLFICHDNDEAGLKMLAKWQRLYIHAKPYPTPVGKDIGEAIQLSMDIRKWLLLGFD